MEYVEELLAAPRDAQPVSGALDDLRDKWKIVDGDCRDGADGLITYHVSAFDDGYRAAISSAPSEPNTSDINFDDAAVIEFSKAMMIKLAKKRSVMRGAVAGRTKLNAVLSTCRTCCKSM